MDQSAIKTATKHALGVPSFYWNQLSLHDFENMQRSGKIKELIVVLPVAATEQHGPHLPVSVDHVIIDGIVAHAVANMPANLPIAILPTMPIGKSNEHAAYPGTLTLSVDTLMRVWSEIGDNLASQGVTKFVLFNSHGGQVSVMDIVVRDLRVKHQMLAIASSWFAWPLPEGVNGDHDIHAGELETAMMRYLTPEHVEMSRAQNFHSATRDWNEQYKYLGLSPAGKIGWQTQDLNAAGACGNAQIATVALGEKLVKHAANQFIEMLAEVHRCPLPKAKARV
jgi:creatinine amidohydrolase